MAQPAKSSSSGLLLSFGDAHDASEASVVEDLDLVGGISLFGPCLSSIQQYTEYHCIVQREVFISKSLYTTSNPKGLAALSPALDGQMKIQVERSRGH